MSKNRFNSIMKYLFDKDDKESCDSIIFGLIDSTNDSFKDAMSPGHILVVDESMVKSYPGEN